MRSIVLPTVLLIGAATVPAVAQTEPSPVPTSMPEGNASPVPTGSAPATVDTDLTRKALAAITYKDCGKGGPGKILITFHNDGTVERVVLAEGTWEPNVAVCVTRRFMEATIPSFEGASRTVKWSVVLEGAPAAPPATYAAPAGYAPYPPYAYRNESTSDVIPGDDGPPPAGYHKEERHRTGALVSGTIITSVGLLLGAMSIDDSGSSRDRQQLQIIALVHLAVGIPLFCVGLTKKKVFVFNTASVSLAPTITKNSATFGLSVRF